MLSQSVLAAPRCAATHDFMFILSVRLGYVQQLSAEELYWDGSWQESFLLEHWPLQLTGAVWGLVADGSACWSPSWLLVPVFSPSSRKRWHLALMERPGYCVAFTFICHPSCVLPSLQEADREKTKPALVPNPHCLRYLCTIYLLIPTKIPLVCGLTWCTVFLMRIMITDSWKWVKSLNDLSILVPEVNI